MPRPVTPLLTVDAVVIAEDRVLLIERLHPPHGWALPGGFVDIGERLADAAARELAEETGISIPSGRLRFVGLFDDPARDPRGHTVTAAYVVEFPATVEARADTDASSARWFPLSDLPPLVFDHRTIVDAARRIINA